VLLFRHSTLGVARFPLPITGRSASRKNSKSFSALPFQQTTDLVERLRGQKVMFEELIIPDEIHDLLRWGDLGTVLQSG
jgi:hypothetical protein